MPELVRYPYLPYLAATEADTDPGLDGGKLSKRERRLYIALAVILSLNLTVICGALTFLGLMLDS
jgi:hypothetical protein